MADNNQKQNQNQNQNKPGQPMKQGDKGFEREDVGVGNKDLNKGDKNTDDQGEITQRNPRQGGQGQNLPDIERE